MTKLIVFGDESGTMPTEDTDSPFVTATVSFAGSQPVSIPPGRGMRWLASTVASLGGIAFFGYVKPKPGYGVALAKRHSKLDTMARMARLIHGRNKDFIPRDGISPRNEVWTLCMQEAVGFAYAVAVHRGRIDAVDVLLDQKTLALEDRNRFRFVLSGQAERLGDVIDRLPAVHDKRARALEQRNQGRPETMSMRWSDEPGANDAALGLKLADQLARYARRWVIDPSRNDLVTVCADEGCPLEGLDVTDIAIKPVARQVIESWKQATGLPEPEA